MTQHYHHEAPADWPQWCVSAYASAHPWEDWAETWAHYLHLTDALETAVACGLALQPLRPDEPSVPPLARRGRLGAFEAMLQLTFRTPRMAIHVFFQGGILRTPSYPQPWYIGIA